MTAVAETHYRINELAKMWKLSRDTIRLLFRNEPGVIKIGKGLTRHGTGRPYLVLSIPESVAMRVKTRISRPLRVV